MAEIDLLLKLFDTLKDSLKDINIGNNALLTNQNDISNHIKGLPMEEVKQLLKDHAKESSDDIDSCTETVESKSDTILNEIKIIKDKIKTMITVVSVAFALFTSAALIGVRVYNIQKEEEAPSHSTLEQTLEDIKLENDSLRQQIEGFHNEEEKRKE